MKITILVSTLFLLTNQFLFSQSVSHDSVQNSRNATYAKFENKMIYPLIKGSKMTGVLPVNNVTNKPEVHNEIKLIFDFTQSTANNAQGIHVNEGLEEVARIMNLHIAAGYKKENLKTVIIFHSGSIVSILNDIFYQKKYNNTNPNNNLLTQLAFAGTEMVVCGQSLQFREVDSKDLLPVIQIAVSAKTTLSKYQQAGYILFSVGDH